MYKYLIADYIVGYCLSFEDYFSTKEIAAELLAPEDDVQKIFDKLYATHPHWFEGNIHSDGSNGLLKRCKTWDEEMIDWLKTGASATLYGEEKLMVDATFNRKKRATTFQRVFERFLRCFLLNRK